MVVKDEQLLGGRPMALASTQIVCEYEDYLGLQTSASRARLYCLQNQSQRHDKNLVRCLIINVTQFTRRAL